MRLTALATFLLLSLLLPSPALALQGPPPILSYQGRLTDASGDLLGGAGTTYYFKFSLWNNATVGSGSRLWPSSAPSATTATVRQGLFAVDIGDTANGYPQALDYDFNTNRDVYLQVEISSDNVSFETLSPRKRVTSAAFAELAGAVSGTTTPSSFGTTSPIGSSVVTIEATSTASILLSIRAIASQVANLFNIEDSSGTQLFSVAASGAASTSALTVSNGFFQGGLADCSSETQTLLYTASTGKFSCGSDSSGGGGQEVNWTYVANVGSQSSGRIYVSTTTNQVIIGATATTSLAKLEVIGNQYVSGNLGIGTTSPGTPLSVTGAGVFTGPVTARSFTATSTATASIFPYASTTAVTVSGTASTTNLVISAAGTGSTKCLQVDGAGLVSAAVAACSSGGSSFGQAFELLADGVTLSPTTTQKGILINAASSTITSLTIVNSTSTNATTTMLAVSGTASTTNLVISAAGTGSTKCLQVNGSGLVAAAAGECGTGGGYTTVQNEGTPLTQRSVINFVGTGVDCADDGADSTDCTINAGAATAAGSDGYVQFNTGNSLDANAGLFYQKSTGRLGISTTTPYAALSVSTSTRPQLLLSDPTAGANLKHFFASSTQGALAFGTLSDDLATLSEKLRLTSGGFLGIGTTSPGTPLSVTGAGVFTGTITAPLFTATSTSAASTLPYASTTAVTVSGTASTTNLVISAAGTGSTKCLQVSGTGLVSAATGECGSGGGITAIGPAGQTENGPTVTFATSSTAYQGLTASTTITGNGSDVITFANTLSGILAAGGGGTGISNPSAAGVLLGAYAGGSWQQVATSSLGISSTDITEGTKLFYTDAQVNSYIHASTTIPKTYTANVFTGANTFNSTFTVGTLNGPLQANAGAVSATTSVTHLYGGTGLTAVPTFGQILRGTGSGYALVATSTLGIAISDTTGTLTVARGGTGVASFTANSLLYSNSAGTALAYAATSSLNIGGTALNVTGTVAVANGGTNSTAQTTNGVNFFNGTSMTSGVGLTFDGTKLGVGSTSPFAKLAVHGLSGENNSLLFAIASSTASATTTLFSVDNTGLTTIGDSSSAGDAVFQLAADANAWSMGYYSTDKTFRIASSTNLSANVYFQIGKSGTTTLNSGITTSNTGQYLCIDATTFEILRNNTACSASSERFKENIAALQYGLNEVMRLRPVTFTFRPEMNWGTSTQLGFIAEEVESIVPELVSYDSTGRVTSVNYPVMTSLLAKAVQDIGLRLEDIAGMAASSTADSSSFAVHFFDNVFARVRTWLADAENGVVDFFANRVRTKELCIGDGSAETCITKATLDALLSGQSASGGSAESAVVGTGETAADMKAPIITLSGNNPATVNIGDTYADLGAIVTDNVDQNLGYKVSLDGGPEIDVSALSLDTSVAGTHEILFSATDNAGNVGTAARTVNVADPNAPATTETTASSTPETQ